MDLENNLKFSRVLSFYCLQYITTVSSFLKIQCRPRDFYSNSIFIIKSPGLIISHSKTISLIKFYLLITRTLIRCSWCRYISYRTSNSSHTRCVLYQFQVSSQWHNRYVVFRLNWQNANGQRRRRHFLSFSWSFEGIGGFYCGAPYLILMRVVH